MEYVELTFYNIFHFPPPPAYRQAFYISLLPN